MKNNKGQALVEFIIILPIFLLLIISIIDFGNIITKKYSLENDMDVISDMYKEEKYDDINKYIKDKKIEISYESNSDFIVISISKDINVISPMLNIVFGKTYKINVEKSIYKNE